MTLFNILNLIKSKDKKANPLLSAIDGKAFEDLLLSRLTDGTTYINMTAADFKDKLTKIEFKSFKKQLLDFSETDTVITTSFVERIASERSLVIKEPFGSQSYPDFILIKNGEILPIECKYSKKSTSKPVWNSSLPRHGGIYIFGAYEHNDVTFFKGESYISVEQRLALKSIFDYAEKMQKEITKSKDGTFSPYLRRMYNQDFNTLKHPKRDIIETKALADVSKW